MLSLDRVTMAKNGRLVIPVAYRRALGLVNGGEVLLRLRDGCVEIEPRRAALERAQRAVRLYASGRHLAEELLRERKEEASTE